MCKCFLFYFLLMVIAACTSPSPRNKQSDYYREPHRLQFHFSPEIGWMNDPNGLVYHDGEYHLFYQYYPDSTVWGPMHWGHTVSTDLVHWQHLPIALYPDSLGYIFSGSAVVDKDNASGFGKEGQISLIAIFTHHDMTGEKAGRTEIETQSIAYSLDKGRTWTKYAGNPVVKNPGLRNFRDPKVFWHEASKHWIMPIAAGDHLDFYHSPDLKHWAKTGEFGQSHGAHGGVWECPDIFPLKTRDGVEKWVLIQNMDRGAVNGGSGTQYFIGHFDGNTFINDNPSSATLWLDYGADNYAGVTWFNAPDGRRLFIGWMSQWFDYAQKVPTHPWRSAMTVPRELSLRRTGEELRLYQLPVPELFHLRTDTIAIAKQEIRDSVKISENATLLELELEFDLSSSTANDFGFILKNTKGEKVIVGFQKTDSTFYIDRTNSGKASFSDKFARVDSAPYIPQGMMKIRALIDVASIEVFVDDGRLAMTEIFFPNEDYAITELFSKGGTIHLLSSKVYMLKSVWN